MTWFFWLCVGVLLGVLISGKVVVRPRAEAELKGPITFRITPDGDRVWVLLRTASGAELQLLATRSDAAWFADRFASAAQAQERKQGEADACVN